MWTLQSNRSLLMSLMVACVCMPHGIAAAGEWKLDGLPAYQARTLQPEKLRIVGSGLGGLVAKWEAAFLRLHPEVQLTESLPTSDAALPGLITRVADLGPDGGEAALTETLAFYETRGYYATEVVVASGAYDVEGHSNGLIVYVNEDNPIRQLTLQQLDGIFGAERTGGLRGFQWVPSAGRSAAGDIRTWDQLGLAGDWSGKSIQTYGHAPSGTARFFQLRVMGNGDKWNPNYHEYVETGSKMIADEDRAAQSAGLHHMLADELARNRYGIAWTVLPQARGVTGIRAVALAEKPGAPYVLPSTESFQNRSYPLVRNIYIYIDRVPGKPVNAVQLEFLRFVLSQDGQRIVADDGGYLPLTSQVAAEELHKLR
jgi:phosphate transport system substrate-binding protein